MTQEETRLQEARKGTSDWKKWGPYLSERQWGTVREDYSKDGNAWDYFTHDQARSRAYHWGEDGLAGISDDKQLLCFALRGFGCYQQTAQPRRHGIRVAGYGCLQQRPLFRCVCGICQADVRGHPCPDQRV